MGLTWIDHDTIEKPIEEITLGTEEADDIEFTVETLKSTAASESNRKANMHKKVDTHHSRPEKFKKSRPKELVKSNKSISRKKKFFFQSKSVFCHFKNG